MVVKILSASANFEGIDYSERKNDQGKSELLLASNFQSLDHCSEEHKKSDYINYMKMIASLNPRVKNKQFHAVISTKGKQHSPEELKNIAVQYLDRMGYGKNPYLIYSHSDTANNHVHLVSTRVDKEGKKVNDKFEKIRSQEVMQEILKMDPKRETSIAVDNALKYNFSSLAQFKLLIEQQGFKIQDEDSTFRLIKYGRVQHVQDKEAVEDKIKTYIPPDDRIKQLKAIFFKYKPGLDLKEFTSFTKEKFGIDLILHQAKGKEKPYGYTIIDHHGREVLKGGKIMSIEELLSTSNKADKLEKANLFISSMLNEGSNFSHLRKEMSKLGFEIDIKGAIKAKGATLPEIQIDAQLLKKLKYNDRVGEASKYSTTSDRLKEKEALAKLFFINPEDLHLKIRGENSSEKYHSILLNIIDSNKADEILASMDMKLIKAFDNYYLIDGKEKEVAIIDQDRVRNLDLDSLEKLDLDRDSELLESTQSKVDYDQKGVIGHIFDIITQSDYSSSEDRKRKRQRSL